MTKKDFDKIKKEKTPHDIIRDHVIGKILLSNRQLTELTNISEERRTIIITKN